MNIKTAEEHNNPEDSQLILIITGTPDNIRRKLKEVSEFGMKPWQGTSLEYKCTTSIITPIWGGKEF